MLVSKFRTIGKVEVWCILLSSGWTLKIKSYSMLRTQLQRPYLTSWKMQSRSMSQFWFTQFVDRAVPPQFWQHTSCESTVGQCWKHSNFSTQGGQTLKSEAHLSNNYNSMNRDCAIVDSDHYRSTLMISLSRAVKVFKKIYRRKRWL